MEQRSNNHRAYRFLRWLVIFFFSLLLTHCSLLPAQQTQIYKPNINRILFVLDGSGSMKQKLSQKSKFETAKELLAKIIDSVEKKNPNVEFAVRVFGFQFPHEQRNCKDSKLLIPFAKNNGGKILLTLNAITPQGMSPISYSLALGAKDFPDDPKSLNSIILITDGMENCGGNPCDASKELAAKKISLKPFIIGLNVDTAERSKFNCVGTFFDTRDEASFYNTVGVIIRQTLNTTTAQINLLDLSGNPTVTNIPFTLYDHSTGKIEYNFVHTMNEKGNPDTLYLDPVGVYDLELHTFPPLWKENIELTPGKHNIIALDVPAGTLDVECTASSFSGNDAQVIVRPEKELKNILNVQDLNTQGDYLKNDYKLEILTNPEIYKDTTLTAFTENDYVVPNYGTLYINTTLNLLASIYCQKNGMLQMVEQFLVNGKTDSHKLQPGTYWLVYRLKNSYNSQSTQTKQFVIEEGRAITLEL